MIRIEKLHVAYGNHQVLKGLSMHVQTGTIHGLVGLNGSGKTTLLNTLYGIMKQKTGTIELEGQKSRRQAIGYLETQQYFYPRITGMEYLKLVSGMNQSFDIKQWNELFELPLEQLIDEYSTGMKMKLAMFGIISLNKSILLLDEPFNGIDLETVYKLKNLLTRFKAQGITIVLTSHILESLVSICDRISYLNGGIIEFTIDQEHFPELEKRIISIHQEKIDLQLQRLLGKD